MSSEFHKVKRKKVEIKKKKKSKEAISKNFPNLAKTINVQIQETKKQVIQT